MKYRFERVQAGVRASVTHLMPQTRRGVTIIPRTAFMNLPQHRSHLLVIFDALMAERSITGAACKVGITPSAMSHALHRLRRPSTMKLLERKRTRHGSDPTRNRVSGHRWARPCDKYSLRLISIWNSIRVPQSALHGADFRLHGPVRGAATLRKGAAEAPNTTLIVDYLHGDGPGSYNPGDIQIRVAPTLGPGVPPATLLLTTFSSRCGAGIRAASQEMTLDLYLSWPHLTASSVGRPDNRRQDWPAKVCRAGSPLRSQAWPR